MGEYRVTSESQTINNRKKLIEVALPLPEINDASAYDKMPGIGPHPKGIPSLVGAAAAPDGPGGTLCFRCR